jgi:hypothetical protein
MTFQFVDVHRPGLRIIFQARTFELNDGVDHGHP